VGLAHRRCAHFARWLQHYAHPGRLARRVRQQLVLEHPPPEIEDAHHKEEEGDRHQRIFDRRLPA
jgi:hypothetical protein